MSQKVNLHYATLEEAITQIVMDNLDNEYDTINDLLDYLHENGDKKITLCVTE